MRAEEVVERERERVLLVGDLAGDGVARVVARVDDGRLDVGQRGVGLGRVVGVVERRDGRPELLAVRASLVGFRGGPDGDGDDGGDRDDREPPAIQLSRRPAPSADGVAGTGAVYVVDMASPSTGLDGMPSRIGARRRAHIRGRP
ncbi:MAG: hypothetical protein ACRDKY_12430 [Solirubrobacteraceae bacterium]